MRTVPLIHKSLILVASLVVLSLMGSPGAALATGTAISLSRTSQSIYQGAMFNSGVTLAFNINASQTSIPVHDNWVMAAGMLIRIGSEYMSIEQAVDGGIGRNDTLVVVRGQYNSGTASHAKDTMIQAQTITITVSATNVTNSWGLGAFSIRMTLPPEVQFIQMVAEQTWLASTNRTPVCDSPVLIGGIWSVSCTTLGNTPLGPKGSGLIATITLLPLQNQLGVHTINFTGSTLTNIKGEVIPATTSNLTIKMLRCPDANLDTWVDAGDYSAVAKNLNDRGHDSGATLVNAIDSSQTNNIAISDRSGLAVGNTIGADMEQMTVSALHTGSPATMDVGRAVNRTKARSHDAGTHIFVADYGGNDGINGYTDVRDVTHDGFLDANDLSVIVKTQAGGSAACPAP